MRTRISRRQLFGLSLLSGLAISFQKLSSVGIFCDNKNVISFYKISVPNNTALYKEIQQINLLNTLNVFSALNLNSFDDNWAVTYDLAKNTAISNSVLLKSEKIYSNKNNSLYVKSTWSNIDGYMHFLNCAQMKKFHEELKKNGYRPELKVFDQYGKEYNLVEFS